MKPYQRRVITEKQELDERLERLTEFSRIGAFHELPEAEQCRMNRQRALMESLSTVLAERIENFQPDEAELIVNDVLNFEYDRWDLEKCTIRHYLVELARTCWKEEEGFSGKRPFGNSGWQFDVYNALAEGGFIRATREEDGWDEHDTEKADAIINACFDRLQCASLNSVPSAVDA